MSRIQEVSGRLLESSCCESERSPHPPPTEPSAHRVLRLRGLAPGLAAVEYETARQLERILSLKSLK